MGIAVWKHVFGHMQRVKAWISLRIHKSLDETLCISVMNLILYILRMLKDTFLLDVAHI